MIPKIIHYCWYGRGQMSSELEMCLDSWRKYCPDYEIKRWDEDNSPMDIPWVHDAYKYQKYAFVADYMRFYVLYHEGGIYMDTDMLLVRPLDKFLSNKAFLGRESAEYANVAIVGTEKHNVFARLVLDVYNSKQFDLMRLVAIPQIVTPLMVRHGLVEDDKTQYLDNEWVVYRSDYFYPITYGQDFKYENVLQYATTDTYGIHLWNYSWADEFDAFSKGEFKQGIYLVLKRFIKTPIMPLQYWKKVIRFCLKSIC